MSLYVPLHFAVGDREAAVRLMHEYPFATMVTASAPEPFVSHVPLLFEDDVLVGHFARANPHAAHARDGASIAIFHGPHAYVSPSFYAEPQAAVPTWNYAVVHAHGTLEIAGVEVRAIVERLVERFESEREAPWRLGLEGTRLDAMLGAIVGFRMRVERLDVKFKLSQNRGRVDRLRVVDALGAEGYAEAEATSQWMRRYASPGEAER